jgi:hypothetical protein
MASGLRILVPIKRVIDYAVSSTFPSMLRAGDRGSQSCTRVFQMDIGPFNVEPILRVGN